jgi:site-specific DNA-methyltransferase (adenine-specific)
MGTKNIPGSVRDAIVRVLSVHGADMGVGDIQIGVQTELGRDIPSSSVRSYLQLNCPDLFRKAGRGRYELASRKVSAKSNSQKLTVYGGKWRLVQDDCFGWLERAATNSIHAVVTDPPYGLVEYSASEQAKLRDRRGGVWRIPPSFDGHQRSPLPRFTTLTASQIEDLRAFFLRWGKALLRVLVPGAHVAVASNPLLSFVVADALYDAGLERRGEVIRLVMTMRGGDRPKNAHREFADVTVMPRSMWEPWLLFRKPLEGRVQDNLRKWKTGGLRRVSREKPFGDVIASHPTRASEREIAPHPSLKPQSFLRQLVRAMLPLGEGIVLDPFAGAGSTLAAAEAIGYASAGIEIDPLYFRIASDAIDKLAALSVRQVQAGDRPNRGAKQQSLLD